MSKLQKMLLKSREHCRLPNRIQAKDFSPLTWDKYFDKYKDITINSDAFRVYIHGNEDEHPVLVLLHGGGYSALTWALFTQEITSRIRCQVLAIDLRGHGETHTSDDDNLSMETLTNDVVSVIEKVCPNNEPVIFIGHSMGGAIAVHCAQAMSNCQGLCVIDVVEGTAMEALASMQIILKNRPTNFTSVQHAIQWCIKSGQTQNLESARISMPGQIKNSETGQLAASETISEEDAKKTVMLNEKCENSIPVINEVDENAESSNDRIDGTVTDRHAQVLESMKPPPTVSSSYVWRINLSKTEIHWKGWFEGLSTHFLNTPVPKLLLLANINGLDTTLMVGQMQGKFQMQVLPRCGHAIHEDLPQKVADIIATFLYRHKITTALLKFQPIFPAC